jgi:phosphoadenosine phosphosulfate reductase
VPTAKYLETVENNNAESIINHLVRETTPNSVCLTCSFQAEDMIVLDLLRSHLPHVPVIFLETGYHFADTYQFRDKITNEWHLNLVNALPRQTVKQQESELGILYTADPGFSRAI